MSALLLWIVGGLVVALLLCLIVVGVARKQERQSTSGGWSSPSPDKVRKRRIALAIWAGTVLLVGVVSALANNEKEDRAAASSAIQTESGR